MAQSIVPGLYLLKVTSLGKFTNALKNLASKTTETKILSISGQSEVQMRISFLTKTEEDFQVITTFKKMNEFTLFTYLPVFLK